MWNGIQSDTFSVRPYPRVEIGLSEVDGCSPLKVSFGNSTRAGLHPITGTWAMATFLQTVFHPIQTYRTNDSTITEYTIRLIARNDCGADTQDRVVKVYPPNVRAFIESPDDEVCQYDSLTFLPSAHRVLPIPGRSYHQTASWPEYRAIQPRCTLIKAGDTPSGSLHKIVASIPTVPL